MERFGEISEEVSSRLDLELQVMADSGFASYFIVVWDFIRWARERKIPVYENAAYKSVFLLNSY